MTYTAACNRAERFAQDTGRVWYVVSNGLGGYWTTDHLDTIPLCGLTVKPYYIAIPPAATKEDPAP